MGRAAGRCGASRAAPARRDAAQRNVPRSSGARRRSSRFVAPACCLHPAPIVATHAARRRPTTHAASRRGAGRHLARPMQACAPERASRANRQAAARRSLGERGPALCGSQRDINAIRRGIGAVRERSERDASVAAHTGRARHASRMATSTHAPLFAARAAPTPCQRVTAAGATPPTPSPHSACSRRACRATGSCIHRAPCRPAKSHRTRDSPSRSPAASHRIRE